MLKSSRSSEAENAEGSDSGHYFYVCVKNADAGRKFDRHWDEVKEQIKKEQSDDLDEVEDLDEDEEEYMYEEGALE